MGRDVPLGRRTLLADPRRAAVSVLGVGLAVALMLLIQGLWSGTLSRITAYEEHVGARLFVAELGTRSFLSDVSTEPAPAVIGCARSPAGTGSRWTTWGRGSRSWTDCVAYRGRLPALLGIYEDGRYLHRGAGPLAAARAPAWESAALLILEDHVNGCVQGAMEGDAAAARARELVSAVRRFVRSV